MTRSKLWNNFFFLTKQPTQVENELLTINIQSCEPFTDQGYIILSVNTHEKLQALKRNLKTEIHLKKEYNTKVVRLQ